MGLVLPLVSSLLGFAAAQGQAPNAGLIWQEGPGYRRAPLIVHAGGKAGFELMTPARTGVNFTNRLSDEAVARNRLLEIGSGVALGDVDGDGQVDIYLCRLEGGNALYRNLGGWKFEEITAASGVACPGQFSTGCALVDVDGDGDLDLLVNSLGGGTRLFLNDGKGRFQERTDTLLARQGGATSLALADVDGDGDLDLYVTHYRTDTFHDNPPGLRVEARRQPDGTTVIEPRSRFVTLVTGSGGLEALERGEGDQLYINKGGGSFAPVRWDVGVFLDEDQKPITGAPSDWGLAVMFRDLNGDGLPDLYVCNDFVYWPDRLWLNQSGKRFQAAPRLTLRNVSLSSMSMDVADINRDGFDDFFVADMLHPKREPRAWQRPDTLSGTISWPVQNPSFRPEVTRNTLQVARGDGTFAEIAQLAGVAATDWTWSSSFLDVDLDGWEDLLITNGSNHDVQDADAMRSFARDGGWKTYETRLRHLGQLPKRVGTGMAFRNKHDLIFEEVGHTWGFDAAGIGQGMAMGDLDNDGALDVVVNCMNGPARVYRNQTGAPRIGVRLKGMGENSHGIGAKIKVLGGPVTQTQEMIAGGRYCSSDDAMRVFAAGEARTLTIQVTWRDGSETVVTDALPNYVYEIQQPAHGTPKDAPNEALPAWFEDATDRLGHTHARTAFDDFQRNPLLPHRLSTLGPSVAWADVDGDGWEDVVVAGGKGDRSAVLRGGKQGTFESWGGFRFPVSADRDASSLLFAPGKERGGSLFLGLSNWEEASTNAPMLEIRGSASADRSETSAQPLTWPGAGSTGPLAMGDIDGDGTLDLFVGGRVVPARYPEAPASRIFLSKNGAWSPGQVLDSVGMVSAAMMVDLNQDGRVDLVLACEWGPIRIFLNHSGTLKEATADLGLAGHAGFWNAIGAGDFDGDGRLDLVGCNWGLNWRTDLFGTADTTVSMFYGESNGSMVTVLASQDPFQSKLTPWREMRALEFVFAGLRERVADHHAFGRASWPQIAGPLATGFKRVDASSFESAVFLNRGDRFEFHALPVEAQFAPAFGAAVADFDGDGRMDVFLSQNFFGMDAETSRQDAGLGLMLKGDGVGGFKALNPGGSGISMFGEQRGVAVGDFDHDGRPDLLVGQHNGPTRLWRNRTAKPGVRVTVRGGEGNLGASGAVLRLIFEAGPGPAHAVTLGNGANSQDAFAKVLATPTPPKALRVLWPGGRSQDYAWPTGVASVRVGIDGMEASP